MTNLLPIPARKEIWRFQRAHFVVVGSFFLFATALLVLFTQLPTAISFQTNYAALEDTANTLLTDSEQDTDREGVLRAKMLIGEFAGVASSTTPIFEALMSTLDVRPKGASIETIRYTKNKDNGSIVINGTASDRSVISTYHDALAKISTFKSVSVPVSAFAGAEDNRYSITLTGTF